jgi:hypothetical protein
MNAFALLDDEREAAEVILESVPAVRETRNTSRHAACDVFPRDLSSEPKMNGFSSKLQSGRLAMIPLH